MSAWRAALRRVVGEPRSPAARSVAATRDPDPQETCSSSAPAASTTPAPATSEQRATRRAAAAPAPHEPERGEPGGEQRRAARRGAAPAVVGEAPVGASARRRPGRSTSDAPTRRAIATTPRSERRAARAATVERGRGASRAPRRGEHGPQAAEPAERRPERRRAGTASAPNSDDDAHSRPAEVGRRQRHGGLAADRAVDREPDREEPERAAEHERAARGRCAAPGASRERRRAPPRAPQQRARTRAPASATRSSVERTSATRPSPPYALQVARARERPQRRVGEHEQRRA